MTADRTRVKTEREEEEKRGGEKGTKKKKKSRLILILGMVFLVLAGGAFAAVRLGLAGGLTALLPGWGEVKPVEEVVKEPEFMLEMPEVVVNLPGERRQFLSLKFFVGYDEPKLTEELEKRKPEIRDAVLRILWSKTAEEISTVEGKERLRQEILETINGMLRKGQLRGVYYWHIMIQ